MSRNLVYSVSAGIASAVLAVTLWAMLVRDHEARVVDVTAAVSYATRSYLVRRLNTQFEVLRRVASSWADDAGVVRTQPELNARIDLAQVPGIEVVAWGDGTGTTRLYSDTAGRAVGRQPTAAEWEGVASAMSTAIALDAELLSPPSLDAGSRAHFTFHVPVHGNREGAGFVALIDMHENLRALLEDDAPGYAVRVTCCNGTVLYESPGFAATGTGVPGADGWIEVLPGVTWNVEHRITPEFLAELRPIAVHFSLVFGMALSVLVAALLYQSRHAADRASAAAAAEAQVRRVNINLEALVAARTKRLDGALRDLNTINLSVAHDLRSPLNVIMLNAHRLMPLVFDSALPNDNAQVARTLVGNAERMAGILDRLLHVSQVSGLEYSVARVDVRALAEGVVEGIRVAENREIDIRLGDLPPASADATMVHILLTNLIENAVKFTRGVAKPVIALGGEPGADGNVYSVADNGPGFPADAVAEIFEPLKRLDTSGRFEGLGLGLAIVVRIVERHGGRVWASSSPGHGATFSFTLPPWRD
jgi:signal transduction histidine kinase